MATVVEKVKATLHIDAKDCRYSVEFRKIFHQYRSWELDPMDDCVGMRKTIDSGKMRVVFSPTEYGMAFPEDAMRNREYVMTVENARKLYREFDRECAYWFALDMADYYSKK